MVPMSKEAVYAELLRKLSSGESLTPDEQAVVIVAGLTVLALAARTSARAIKPVVDRLASMDLPSGLA